MQLRRKQALAQKRRWRIRNKLRGSAARPRLVVTFTNQHLYAQCIDDDAGRTLVYLSSVKKDLREEKLKPNREGAKTMGQKLAQTALAQGITAVVFDRAGRRYHGCVKDFADAAREAGLQF